MLGLFKSYCERGSEALQQHINFLKGLDNNGLAGVALYCSVGRLMDLDFVYKNDIGSSLEYYALFYHPLSVDEKLINEAVKKYDQVLKKTKQAERSVTPFGQGVLGLLGTSIQTWRNTWVCCQCKEVRHLGQEMWSLISCGFPYVETVADLLMSDPNFDASDADIRFFIRAITDGGEGPDFVRIPEGFESPKR